MNVGDESMLGGSARAGDDANMTIFGKNKYSKLSRCFAPSGRSEVEW